MNSKFGFGSLQCSSNTNLTKKKKDYNKKKINVSMERMKTVLQKMSGPSLKIYKRNYYKTMIEI